MKLVDVKEIPKRTAKHHLQKMLADFMESDSSIVMIELNAGEYKSASVCCNCLRVAIKRMRFPIKVHIRNQRVYMKKI